MGQKIAVREVKQKHGGGEVRASEKDKYENFLPKITTKKIPYGEHALKNLDTQLPLRPEKVVYCRKCVVSNQRPGVTIDENGICSACSYRDHKNSVVDWNKRKTEFEALLDKYRSKDGKWDVVVPCSGGKDSGSVAHKLKYKHGMHPLCVTWSPLLYTPVGMQNLQNMISSGLDHHLSSPNRILQRKIARLAFVFQGDHFEAFSRGQYPAPVYAALKHDIKLIMLGEDGQLEYGGRPEEKPQDSIDNWDQFYYKHVSLDNLLKAGVKYGYLNEEDLKDESLEYYKLPKKADVAIHWFGYYNEWMPFENYRYTKENYNLKGLPERSEGTYTKYASIDDMTDPFHYYMMLIKFGIGRATSDAAHEIRDGHLTREDAVRHVQQYDHEFPHKYFDTFLKYLDICKEEFWEVVNTFRSISPHIWEKKKGVWLLKKQVE